MRGSSDQFGEAQIDAKLRRAVTLHQGGRFAQARLLYEEILRQQPRHFHALHLLGVVTAACGDPGRGASLIGQALELQPHDASARNNRGGALSALKEWDAALREFDHAIRLAPGHADAHYNRANVLRELRRWDAAVESIERAIACKPDSALFHFQHGNLLCQLRRWESAAAAYTRTLALDDGNADAWSNRALALFELRRMDEALASADSAIRVKADSATAHGNRAGILVALHRVDEALVSFDRALALAPQSAALHVGRGLALLLAGRYEAGWAEYEWRWRDPASWVMQDRRDFPQPRWLGHEPLAGRTILVHCEQGYGDTIQFCRFAPLLAQRGARVILEVPAALESLMASLEGIHQVVVHGSELPAFDCYSSLLSLPFALGTSFATVPASVPYLAADDARRRLWRERIGEASRPRVGLVWAGAHRPGRPELWSVNGRRNVPLELFDVLDNPRIEFFNLQLGEPMSSEPARLRERGWCGPELRDFTGELREFADTAALMEQLDLVICVDTAAAHLAGALAKPVWILNRFDTCWRWLLEREDSPWYPTARIYRQASPGDWGSVMQRVASDLEQWAAPPCAAPR